jgi:hypothetical protein
VSVNNIAVPAIFDSVKTYDSLLLKMNTGEIWGIFTSSPVVFTISSRNTMASSINHQYVLLTLNATGVVWRKAFMVNRLVSNVATLASVKQSDVTFVSALSVPGALNNTLLVSLRIFASNDTYTIAAIQSQLFENMDITANITAWSAQTIISAISNYSRPVPPLYSTQPFSGVMRIVKMGYDTNDNNSPFVNATSNVTFNQFKQFRYSTRTKCGMNMLTRCDAVERTLLAFKLVWKQQKYLLPLRTSS